MRRIVLSALIISGCSIPVTVNGQTRMMRIGGGSTRDQLTDVNNRVNATRKLLLERVGVDAAAERKAIDQASQELAAERTSLTAIKPDKTVFQQVNENLTDAEAWLAASNAAYEAEWMLAPAIKADGAGQEITADQLAVIDSKVSASQQRANDSWKQVASAQRTRLDTLKKNVSAGPERRAETKRRSEAKAKSDALEAQQKAAREVGHAATESLKNLWKALEHFEVPNDGQITELEQRAAAVEAIIPTGGQFYRNEAGLLRIYGNLQQTDGAERLKTQLGGAVAAKGEAHGKDYKVQVKAAANHCYVFFGEIISWGGQEEIIQPAMQTPSTGVSMQEFEIDFANDGMMDKKWKGVVSQGACAVQPGNITFSGGLKVAGSRNGLRYVVLDYARTEFPALLASRLEVHLPDRCDPDAWQNLFTNPVPGSVAWLGGEPVVVMSMDFVGGNRDANYAHAGTGGWVNTKKHNLASSPPARVQFKTPFEFKGCPERQNNVMPRAPLSRSIEECALSIEKKQAGAWAGIDRARDVADRASSTYVKFYNPAAEEKAGRLRDAYDREYAQRCQPLEDKARKTLEARFNKLVDTLTDAPPNDPLKRAELNASEEDAPFRRW